MMDDADMDSFVFCLATKRASGRLLKDHADLVSGQQRPVLPELGLIMHFYHPAAQTEDCQGVSKRP